LPIELLDYRVSVAEKAVNLSWITGAEVNNDYFTIEKSKVGLTFSL
jgi:hypothetical protein